MTLIDRKIAPKFNSISSVEFISPEKKSLDNGVNVHLISGGSQEILKIDFIFDAGVWFQKKPLIAKATNSLIKEGTKNHTASEIAEGIDQYGAFIQTESDFDKAHITIYTLSKHLNNVLPFVKEVLLYPQFDNNEFVTYQRNAIERFKINQEKVSFLARNEFMKQLFGLGNPYGKIASLKDFEGLSLSHIKNHYSSFYGLNNCEIIVSGKITDNTFKAINHFFGAAEIPSSVSTTNDTAITTSNSTEKVFIEKPDALQSAIRIGKIMPNKTHTDYFKLQILNTVLGGYFGSRLMKNIREDKGYTYGIGSGILSLQNGGYFYISTEVGSNVTQKALDEIYKEIQLIQSELIGNDELNLVKNYLLGSLLKSSDGPFKMGALFENVHFYGFDFDFYNQYIEAIKNTSADELKEIANQYLNIDSLSEIIVGKSN